jgi:hypothetical protein
MIPRMLYPLECWANADRVLYVHVPDIVLVYSASVRSTTTKKVLRQQPKSFLNSILF